jgi:hypothetical protein
MGWKEHKLLTWGRQVRNILVASLAVLFIGGSMFYVTAARNTFELANSQLLISNLTEPGPNALSETNMPAGNTVQQGLYCASDDGRRHYCNVDTRGGVRLVQQRSGSPCIQGRTWGYDRNGIWVDRGCRAEFETNVRYSGNDYYYGRDPYYNRDRSRDRYYGYGRNRNYGYGGGYNVQTFYCESGDMRRHWCSEGLYGEVRLVRQRSNSPCIQGQTWGRDRGGVWVDRGCRADFEVIR